MGCPRGAVKATILPAIVHRRVAQVGVRERRCEPMRAAIRENAWCALAALCGCAALAWLGLYAFAWNDYDNEARAAVDALAHGHLTQFLQLAPVYGGSLVERAPFALVPGLWGAGDLAIYRTMAIPCLLATAVLGVILVAGMRSRGRSRLARGVVLALCVANPVALYALELGHPEELLGGSMCVAAVLLLAGESVGRGRAVAAGVLLGLAIANKQWALIAAGPVLLACPGRLRARCLAAAVASAAVVLAPLVLVTSGGLVSGTRALASPASTIFQPWQAWWFLGHHGALVHGAFGTPKPGYRTGPAWTGAISHPLIITVSLAVTLWLWRSRRRLSERDALLALALLLLLRCLLDTWDAVYYPLPFLLALLAWEVRGPAGRPPVLALSGTVLVWLSFHWLALHASADVQAASFLAWALPLAAWLAWRLRSAAPRRSVLGEAPAGAQEITVSAFGKLVRTS
jgi:hypothetical protein